MDMIEAENLRTIEQAIHEEFVIDKILNKREQDGKIEYFVKWCKVGVPSWEQAENLTSDTIAVFEDELKRKQEQNSATTSSRLEAEQIIGCTDNLGFLQFLVKWKGVDQADLMSAKEAKEKYPKVCAEFFKERLSWGKGS